MPVPLSFRDSCFHFPFPGLSGLEKKAPQPTARPVRPLPGPARGGTTAHRTRGLGCSQSTYYLLPSSSSIGWLLPHPRPWACLAGPAGPLFWRKRAERLASPNQERQGRAGPSFSPLLSPRAEALLSPTMLMKAVNHRHARWGNQISDHVEECGCGLVR